MENIEILALDTLKPTFSDQKQFHYHFPSIRESVRNIAVLFVIYIFLYYQILQYMLTWLSVLFSSQSFEVFQFNEFVLHLFYKNK